MAHQKMLCLWGACDRGSGRERLERADRRKGNLLRGRRRRPVGQAVKTPASHAGNAGSIPARVTRGHDRRMAEMIYRALRQAIRKGTFVGEICRFNSWYLLR